MSRKRTDEGVAILEREILQARYLADERTNVLPVKLYPGRKYAIWFNSPNYKHNAFRDRANKPAIPYLLVFETSD